MRKGPAFAAIAILSALYQYNCFLFCGFLILCTFFCYYIFMWCVSYSSSWVSPSLGYELHLRKCSFHYSPFSVHIHGITEKLWPILKLGLREFLQSLSFWISSSKHFLIFQCSWLHTFPCPSYFIQFRVHKLILECSLCYLCKNRIVGFFFKLFPSSILHNGNKSLSDQGL